MSLRLDVFKLVSFSMMSTILTKVMGVVSFLVVVRLLPRSDIGLIGVIAGYTAMLGFLALGPEAVLVRDFPKIKDRLNDYLSGFIRFWFFRSIVVMIIAGAIALWLYFFFHDISFPIYMIGIAISINMTQFEQIIKEVFYVDFKQKIATKMTFALEVISFGMLLSLFFYGYILVYILVIVLSSIINACIWFYLLRKHYHFHFMPHTKDIIKVSILDYSLWAHLSNSFMSLVYRIDTFILSFFVGLSAIGNYTIALEIGNFFFIIPRLLQKSVMIGTVNLKNPERLNDVISIFVKYFLLLSIAQVAGFLLLGRWIVALFTDTAVEDIYLYSLLIVTGVSILNVFRPISTIINTHASMKKGFYFVYLPASVISIAIYYYMALTYGVLGVAIGNIFAFSILSLFIIVFVQRSFPLKIRLRLFSDIEQGLLKDVLRK